MSLRTALRAIVRFTIVATVLLSGVTFGADDAEARRGGKVRSSRSNAEPHIKPHDGAKQHESAETTRKSGDAEDGSAAPSGGAHVPGVRVRSREATHGTTETTTDAGGTASPHGVSLMPTAGPKKAANKDIDVPGCGHGMICTVCLAGCEGQVNSIVDAEPTTPRPKPRQ